MKRLFVLLFTLYSLSSFSQVMYSPTIGYGYVWRRGQVDSTFHLPVSNIDTMLSVQKRDGGLRYNPDKKIIQLWKDNIWYDLDSVAIGRLDTLRWNRTSRLFKAPTVYTGTTDANGNYTVTYTTSFAAAPFVVPVQVPGAIRQELFVSSSTTTGFTIKLQQRNEVAGLLPTYTNVSGATLTVFVIEK